MAPPAAPRLRSASFAGGVANDRLVSRAVPVMLTASPGSGGATLRPCTGRSLSHPRRTPAPSFAGCAAPSSRRGAARQPCARGQERAAAAAFVARGARGTRAHASCLDPTRDAHHCRPRERATPRRRRRHRVAPDRAVQLRKANWSTRRLRWHTPPLMVRIPRCGSSGREHRATSAPAVVGVASSSRAKLPARC